MSVTLLAIESSCDETAAAVIQDGNILCNIVASQRIHEKYGGIVPELASRAHQQHIIPVVSQALLQANIQKSDLNAVACTSGPGLLGALLVGVSFSKAFASALNIPVIKVNHMKAHILAHFVDDPKPAFPFICLTVSGGHTQLVIVKSHLEMEVIGETQDDAVGEAFDKTAKLMGLPYPGGPLIDSYAKQGNPLAFPFPTVEMPGYSFSFSGIKTAFMYFLKKNTAIDPEFIQKNLPDISASVQHTLIEVLMRKLKRLVVDTGISRVAIAGGVSANSGLRKAMEQKRDTEGWDVYIPAFEYCTDNAAMIAVAGYYQYLEKDFAAWDVSPEPRLKIGGGIIK